MTKVLGIRQRGWQVNRQILQSTIPQFHLCFAIFVLENVKCRTATAVAFANRFSILGPES